MKFEQAITTVALSKALTASDLPNNGAVGSNPAPGLVCDMSCTDEGLVMEKSVRPRCLTIRLKGFAIQN